MEWKSLTNWENSSWHKDDIMLPDNCNHCWLRRKTRFTRVRLGRALLVHPRSLRRDKGIFGSIPAFRDRNCQTPEWSCRVVEVENVRWKTFSGNKFNDRWCSTFLPPAAWRNWESTIYSEELLLKNLSWDHHHHVFSLPSRTDSQYSISNIQSFRTAKTTPTGWAIFFWSFWGYGTELYLCW